MAPKSNCNASQKLVNKSIHCYPRIQLIEISFISSELSITFLISSIVSKITEEFYWLPTKISQFEFEIIKYLNISNTNLFTVYCLNKLLKNLFLLNQLF